MTLQASGVDPRWVRSGAEQRLSRLLSRIGCFQSRRPVVLRLMADQLSKVWAHPTTEMSWNWLGERVATVDAKKVIANVLKNTADGNWGPNAVFRCYYCEFLFFVFSRGPTMWNPGVRSREPAGD